MDAHGYRLAGNENTAAPDIFPSLIGVDPNGLKSRPDPYFDRIDINRSDDHQLGDQPLGHLR
jgi:hypothetical protein